MLEMGSPPAVDPHTLLKGLIETNMVSPDGVWTPVVNSGWLQVKKQKTFQISIASGYGDIRVANLIPTTGATAGQIPTVMEQFYMVTLYHNTRTGVWSLYRNFASLMNTANLTVFNGVNGNTDYRYARILRSDDTKAMKGLDKECGFDDPPKGDEMGYRVDVTVAVCWHE